MGMILTKDNKELMINLGTGQLFTRDLKAEELDAIEKARRFEDFKKIVNAYPNAVAKQLDCLIEEGFDLEEIADFALRLGVEEDSINGWQEVEA
jgi:hypothetical protein